MAGRVPLMHDELELDGGLDGSVPVWAVFGDLMAGLLGAFVLIALCALGAQLELAKRLDAALEREHAQAVQHAALEAALAGPLASGRITLDHGRIGIAGNLLFAFNSADLQPEGRQLLHGLAGPLAAWLRDRDELLMVSGFTDDRPVRGGTRQFADNWELSAQRALTVTRTLVEEGVPAGDVFAAAFGAGQPVASNDDADGRARNRRVEMAPMPRAARDAAEAASAASMPQAAGPVASAAGAGRLAGSAAMPVADSSVAAVPIPRTVPAAATASAGSVAMAASAASAAPVSGHAHHAPVRAGHRAPAPHARPHHG